MKDFCLSYNSSSSYNFLCKTSFFWSIISLIFLFSFCFYAILRILYSNLKSDEFNFSSDLRYHVQRAINKTICRWITNSHCLNFIIFCLFIFFAVVSTSLLYVIDAIALTFFGPGNNIQLLYYTMLEIPVNIFQCCPFFMVMFVLEVTKMKSIRDLEPRQSLTQSTYTESERRNLTRFILKKSIVVTGILFCSLQAIALYAEVGGKVLDDSTAVYSVFKILNYSILFATSVSLLSFLSHEKNAQAIRIQLSRANHKEQLIIKFLQDQELDSTSVFKIVDAVSQNKEMCQQCNRENYYCFHGLEKAIEGKIAMNFERLKQQIKNTENDSSLPLLPNSRNGTLWLKIPIVLITTTYFILDICAISSFLLTVLSKENKIHTGVFGWLRTIFEIINMMVISITIPLLIAERNVFGDPPEYFTFMLEFQNHHQSETGSFLSLIGNQYNL